jgi:DNA-binding NtrC family response regulator
MSFSQDDPIKILIADHDPRIRSTLRSRLKLKGHTVITADSGAETLRLVQIFSSWMCCSRIWMVFGFLLGSVGDPMCL